MIFLNANFSPRLNMSAQGRRLGLATVAQPLDDARVPLDDGGLFTHLGAAWPERHLLRHSLGRIGHVRARPRLDRAHRSEVHRRIYGALARQHAKRVLLQAQVLEKVLHLLGGLDRQLLVVGARNRRQECGTRVPMADVRLGAQNRPPSARVVVRRQQLVLLLGALGLGFSGQTDLARRPHPRTATLAAARRATHVVRGGAAAWVVAAVAARGGARRVVASLVRTQVGQRFVRHRTQQGARRRRWRRVPTARVDLFAGDLENGFL